MNELVEYRNESLNPFFERTISENDSGTAIAGLFRSGDPPIIYKEDVFTVEPEFPP
jgi:hypothetical protein